MAEYRVGMIGVGRKGTQHARAYALNPRTEVVAAADPDPENLELFCDRFGVPGYDRYEDMLAEQELDIAGPILPVHPNPEVVIACAESGVKAILCEKPMAASLREADRMVEACQARGIKLAAGDLDRNLPGFGKARDLIDSGALGQVRSLTFVGGSGTEISGGGCQILSLMRLLAGDAEVAWVIGWMAQDPWSDHDQGAAGYVRFVNGIEAFIHREPDGRGRGFEVAGTRGLLRYNNEVLSLWQGRDGEEPGAWDDLEKVEETFEASGVYGRRSREYDADGWRWPGDRNVATVQAIVDALDGGVESGGSGQNGLKVLEIAIALRESHRRGHAAVQLPLQDRSLRLFPHASRMDNKKPLFGREAYMAQVRSATRTPSSRGSET